ncbi:MAG: hypothetical protein ACTSQE_02910 [Candidatus Heimdallarchaeaceae archaeon]
MTLYSPQIDMMITIVISTICSVGLFIPVPPSMRKMKGIIYVSTLFLLIIVPIVGLYLGIKDIIFFYCLTLTIILILKTILDEQQAKHIWFTLVFLSFSILIITLKLELLFLLFLILTFVIFIFSIYIGYVESLLKRQRYNRYNIAIGVILSLIFTSPLFLFVNKISKDQFILYGDFETDPFSSIILYPVILLVFFIILIGILEKTLKKNKRSEESWYQ